MDVNFQFVSKMNELIINNIGVERISDIVKEEKCYLRINCEDFYINIVYKLKMKFTVKGNIRLEDVKIINLYSTNVQKAKKLLEWINQSVDEIEEKNNYRDIGYLFPTVTKCEFDAEKSHTEIF